MDISKPTKHLAPRRGCFSQEVGDSVRHVISKTYQAVLSEFDGGRGNVVSEPLTNQEPKRPRRTLQQRAACELTNYLATGNRTDYLPP